MKSDAVKAQYKKILLSLESGNVADAFDMLDALVADEQNYKVKDELQRLRQTYGYILHYMLEGIEDPTRESQYLSVVEQLREMAEEVLYERLLSESASIYFSTARTVRLRNLDLGKLLENLSDLDVKIGLAKSAGNPYGPMMGERDSLLKDIFNLIWTSRNNKEIRKVINERIRSEENVELSIFFVSAVTLSLLGYYDKVKLETLLDIYENTENESLAGVVLTALVLSIRRHREHVLNDRALISRLELWQDSIVTYSRLRDIVKEIIRTRDTDRVTAKMRDEVMPELMKLNPEIIKKLRESGSDFESMTFEDNPEWEEILEKNGLAEKMQELTEMQSEGADLMMVTFASLKGFPFFSSPEAWFLPFDIDHPAIHLEDSVRSTLSSVLQIGKGMCDSDKYSLALAFGSMPESQKKMMLSQLDAQLSQLSEEMKEQIEKNSRPEFNERVLLFIRQLYRFFKLFRNKGEFADPFAEPFDFLSLPIMGGMMADEEILKITSEFYFKRGYYKEALELFRKLETPLSMEGDYWEKVGYALQCLKRYEDAEVAYRKAELLKEPSQWLLKKLAFILRKNGRSADAVEYYERVLEGEPDNVGIIMSSGYARYDSGDIQGAIKDYYHANYLEPDNQRILRALAWAELLVGNSDKSVKLYDRIIADRPASTDYLNAGHAQLVSGNLKKAYEYYTLSSKDDMNAFEMAFKSDYDVLEKLGVQKITLNLILDKLKLK